MTAEHGEQNKKPKANNTRQPKIRPPYPTEHQLRQALGSSHSGAKGVYQTDTDRRRLHFMLLHGGDYNDAEYKPQHLRMPAVQRSLAVFLAEQATKQPQSESTTDTSPASNQVEKHAKPDRECLKVLEQLQFIYDCVVGRIKDDPRKDIMLLEDPQNMTANTVSGVTLREGVNTLVIAIRPGPTEDKDILQIYHKRKYQFANSTEPELITTTAILNSDGSFNSKTDYKPGNTYTSLVGRYETQKLNQGTRLTPVNLAVAKE